MKSPSRLLLRGVMVASLATVLVTASSLAPRAQAQAPGAGLKLVGIYSVAPHAVPVSYIITLGSKAIYYPSYINNCVASANPGFAIYNNTTVSQNVTDGNGVTIVTIPSKKAAGFNAGGTPGFYFVLLGSNNSTALLAHCS